MAESNKENWDFLHLFALATVLDIIFKQFSFLTPVQPILPIALLAGILYGARKGLIVGCLSVIISSVLFYSADFFSGSLFFLQFASAIFAGLLGGAIAKSQKVSTSSFVGLTVVAVIFFEALNNFLQGSSFSRLSGYYYLEGTMLASALHLIVSILLALMLASLLSDKEKK